MNYSQSLNLKMRQGEIRERWKGTGLGRKRKSCKGPGLSLLEKKGYSLQSCLSSVFHVFMISDKQNQISTVTSDGLGSGELQLPGQPSQGQKGGSGLLMGHVESKGLQEFW